MPKINRYGLNLRKKSTVHASIIDETTGRRNVEATILAEDAISKREESWLVNGESSLWEYLDYTPGAFLKPDLEFLKKTKDPAIFILGPGKGKEVEVLNSLLDGKHSSIDTIGITNQLSAEAGKIVRKDYSPDISKLSKKDLFENFNHLKFVKKYDYIYTNLGPVYHTNVPEIAILKLTSMLKPSGMARIVHGIGTRTDLILKNILQYLKKTGHKKDLIIIDDKRSGSFLVKRLK